MAIVHLLWRDLVNGGGNYRLEPLVGEQAPGECNVVRSLWIERGLRGPKSARLSVEGVEQSVDGAIQVFIGPAQSVNLVDGVQYRGVVLAAKLPADLRQGSRG